MVNLLCPSTQVSSSLSYYSVYINWKGMTLTSGQPQHGGTRASRFRWSKDRPMDELFEQEFQVCFQIPDSIDIQLSNSDALPTHSLPT